MVQLISAVDNQHWDVGNFILNLGRLVKTLCKMPAVLTKHNNVRVEAPPCKNTINNKRHLLSFLPLFCPVSPVSGVMLFENCATAVISLHFRAVNEDVQLAYESKSLWETACFAMRRLHVQNPFGGLSVWGLHVDGLLCFPPIVQVSPLKARNCESDWCVSPVMDWRPHPECIPCLDSIVCWRSIG